MSAPPPTPTHPDALTLQSRPRPRREVTAVPGGEGLVLHEPTRGTVHRLDRLGAQLWQRLDGSVRLADLADELAQAFPGEDRNRLRVDLVAFARSLGHAGLLQGVDPAAADHAAVDPTATDPAAADPGRDD